MKLVDLFCGSGGFSLGAHQAGFDVAAAFDIDPILTSSFRYNFPKTELHLTDVGALSGDAIKQIVGDRIDGIFGGPPCQGFSSIGRRDVNDLRRQLLHHFFRIVGEVRPKFFVMENVPGLGHANARGELDSAVNLIADKYEILGPHVWDASQFGAATKRPRIFVIGIDRQECDAISFEDISARKRSAATVADAIGDLRAAKHLHDENDFDVWKISDDATPSSYANDLRSLDRLFTGHRFTTHTPPVVERFRAVKQGELDRVGRHPRLAWAGQCPTLRAGTGADRGSYQAVRPIHPNEPRVITVREAARLQGFPDQHRFHPTTWHSFRMIGNSVSPIVAKAIFQAIADKVDLPARHRQASLG